MQGRKRDADVESGLVDTVREEESEKNEESNINIYTLSGVRWVADEKLLCSAWSPVWCPVIDDLEA